MRTSTNRLVTACLSAALLAACGGSNGRFSSTTTSVVPQSAPVGSAAAVGKMASNPMLYVANIGYNDVIAYDSTGKRTLTITAGLDEPFGVAVDKSGKVYVANTFLHHFGGNVTTYTPDGKRTKPTITDGISFPLDVVVDKNGKIYVTNLNDYSGNGFITTYKPDGTRTTLTITAGIAGPIGLTVDA
ncbi:MAG: hypothetical protein WAK19_14555, partial [Candidatus Cybelea sp.]